MKAYSRLNEFRFKLKEMQFYPSTRDDVDHAPVVAPARRKSWLVRAAGEVKVRFNRMRERQLLEAMSDRELSDIGLTRYDIPRVFDPEFAKERSVIAPT